MESIIQSCTISFIVIMLIVIFGKDYIIKFAEQDIKEKCCCCNTINNEECNK